MCIRDSHIGDEDIIHTTRNQDKETHYTQRDLAEVLSEGVKDLMEVITTQIDIINDGRSSETVIVDVYKRQVVAKGMFRATNIVSIPSNLFDKAKKLENTANMFSLCSSLADVSIGLPNSVTVMTDMFLDTRALRGTIVLSDGITDRCV